MVLVWLSDELSVNWLPLIGLGYLCKICVSVSGGLHFSFL